MTLANEILERFKDYRTFTSHDIHIAFSVRHKMISDKTIQVTVSRMVKQGRLYAITKGAFSREKRDELVGFAFAPFYYGGLAAMMMRDMIDNQVKMEIMTIHRVTRSLIKVYGGSSVVVLHHTPLKYYFGFDNLKYGDLTVPVSNPEKTLIDLFYYKIKLQIERYSNLLKAVNRKRLRKYLKVYDKRTAKLVLNFVKEYKPAADAGKLESPY